MSRNKVSGVWARRFAVVLRPLRDLGAAPITIFIETRTAAQASRDAITQHPDMKVLSVARASAEMETPSAEERDVVIPIASAADRR
jgi:hypothetical protein